MASYRTAALVVVCISLGAVGAVLFGGAGGTTVQAQPAAAAPGRYQISAYGYGGGGGAGARSVQGAYILDTQTGEVFGVVNNEVPTLIGSVAKAKK